MNYTATTICFKCVYHRQQYRTFVQYFQCRDSILIKDEVAEYGC